MKKLIILSLSLFILSCNKEITVTPLEITVKTLGADQLGNTDEIQIITSNAFNLQTPGDPDRGSSNKGKPVKPPIVIPPTPLPTSYSLNMTYVINQGSEGSCNAQNVCYARSYLSGIKLSPEFLFNLSKSSINCTGSALLTNLNISRDSGICTWVSMPYDWTNGCSLQPNDQQRLEAQKYRIKSYSMIYANDITAIKTMISTNRPLVFQVTADQQFLDATTGFIWKSFTGAMGAHGITLVGYDDAKNAYKILNSWGTSWGDNGFSWIDYNFFTTVSSNLFVMNL